MTAPRFTEPPLIERARRIGWLLLFAALAGVSVYRFGPPGLRLPALVAGCTAALLGLLAIVNVALVRYLYRQVAIAAANEAAAEEAGASAPRDG
jgi:hypothetical protein